MAAAETGAQRVRTRFAAVSHCFLFPNPLAVNVCARKIPRFPFLTCTVLQLIMYCTSVRAQSICAIVQQSLWLVQMHLFYLCGR